MDELLKMAVSSGLGVAFLVVALKWLNHDRDKILAALDGERNNRIRLLEEASKRCAEDRIVMHREMSLLQAEVRDLYKRMVATTAAGTCGGECAKGFPEKDREHETNHEPRTT